MAFLNVIQHQRYSLNQQKNGSEVTTKRDVWQNISFLYLIKGR